MKREAEKTIRELENFLEASKGMGFMEGQRHLAKSVAHALRYSVALDERTRRSESTTDERLGGLCDFVNRLDERIAAIDQRIRALAAIRTRPVDPESSSGAREVRQLVLAARNAVECKFVSGPHGWLAQALKPFKHRREFGS